MTMDVLVAVVEDLFQFAKKALFGVRPLVNKNNSIPLFFFGEQDKSTSLDTPNSKNKYYFLGEDAVWLYVDPVISFDTAATRIPYGENVYVDDFTGRWAEVYWGELHGWILKDCLRTAQSEVFPTFVSGEYYGANNKNTQKMRLYIDDMFSCGIAGLPLSSAEYIAYTLQKKKKYLPWTEVRPRVPGLWQQIFKGRPGVHIGITPFPDSIMEYTAGNCGHLAIIDAVFPDESILVRAVGIQEEGCYQEILISKDEYKELRPVFIEIDG